MKSIFVLLLAAMLVGCAGLGQSNMSAEQLQALAKEKSIGIMTTEVNGIWGILKNKVITVDQKVLIDGTVTVAPDGSVTVTNKTPLATPRTGSASPAAMVQVPVLVQAVPVIPSQ